MRRDWLPLLPELLRLVEHGLRGAQKIIEDEAFAGDVLLIHRGIMDRGDVLLQGLLSGLRKWFPAIERGTHVQLTVVPVRSDGFILRATWPNGGQYEHHFSKAYCFGASYRLSTQAWAIEKRTCDHARAFMRSVLAGRGAM